MQLYHALIKNPDTIRPLITTLKGLSPDQWRNLWLNPEEFYKNRSANCSDPSNDLLLKWLKLKGDAAAKAESYNILLFCLKDDQLVLTSNLSHLKKDARGCRLLERIGPDGRKRYDILIK